MTTAITKVDRILTNATVITMDAQWQIFSPGAIAITGSAIVAVGPAAKISAAYQAETTDDFSGKTIIPGLVNAHTHAPMTLLRGLADDLRLDVWLLGYMMPVERAFVNPEFCRIGTLLACAEMIRSGVTCFADMYYFEEDVAAAAAEAGMRALCSQTVMKFPTPDSASWEDGLALARAFIERWKNHELILPSVGPHAPYTCPPEVLQACSALACEFDVPLHIHIAETAREVTENRALHNMPVVPWAKKQNVFDAKVLAAHCVHIDSGEIRTLHNHRVGIAHNPTSNLKLASGIAPVMEMLNAGLNVGIGTDGPASNNDLDMLEETRLAALLAKTANNDPTVLPARQALAMATIMGARALHIGDITGSLEPGKRADISVLELNTLHNTPAFKREGDAIYSQIVYAAKGGDISDVMVNGKWLLQARKLLTVDEAAVAARARAIANEIDNFLIKREQSVLLKLLAIGDIQQQESFEVQVKVRISDPQLVIKNLRNSALTILRHVRYRQYDTYFAFAPPESDRLRVREDVALSDTGEPTTQIRYRLTLIGPAASRAAPASALLSRSRYLAPSNHTPRFYREYFRPAAETHVQKDRQRWQVAFRGVQFYVNIDEVSDPELGFFLEVKSRTWSRRDADDKASLIDELLQLLGADLTQTVREDFPDLV
jgi:5-methylthioadenosine/S-adenosylhomocysteine deaminase